MQIQEYRISESCFEYRFGDVIDSHVNNAVLKAYRYLKTHYPLQEQGVLDLIPSYTSLSLHLHVSSPLLEKRQALVEAMTAFDPAQHDITSNHYEIKAVYNGEDLEDVARELKLEVDDVIALHVSPRYRIAMIGFRPGFSYLLGLDARLKLARHHSPRARVERGSIAIADNQSGIYSQSSPGGWHIIAHTDFEDYDALLPGDTLQFRSIHVH